MRKVHIGNTSLGDGHQLLLISGPCVIESQEQTIASAERLKEICERLGVPLIFKASYDKANRSSADSFRGPGLEQGLFIMEKIKKEFDLLITTDVHSPKEALAAAQVCDVLQIPAFLCRQTDLLLAAGHTGKVVNIKKGQFMAPWDMETAVEKVLSTGNKNILITDRGTSFGYNNLVSDMRAIPIMRKTAPVCFDATHSVQLPGGNKTTSGGQREFVETLAKSAIAAGADALFLEAHPDPANAKSDRGCQLPFDQLESLLEKAIPLFELTKSFEVAHV